MISGGLAKGKISPAWTERWLMQGATTSCRVWARKAPLNIMGGDSPQHLSGGKQHPIETEVCFPHKQNLFSTESLHQKINL